MAVLAGKVGTGLGGMLAVGEVVDTVLWVAEGVLVVGALVAGVGGIFLVVVVGILIEVAVGTLVVAVCS